MNESFASQYAELDNAKKYITDLKTVFEELRQLRAKQLGPLLAKVTMYAQNLPPKPRDASSNWQPVEVEALKYELEQRKEHPYQGYEWAEYADANPGHFSNILENRIKFLNDTVTGYENDIEYLKYSVANYEEIWKKAASDWKEFAGSIEYTQEEYDQFTVLVNKGFSKKNNIDYYTTIATNDIPRYISQMKSLNSQYEQTLKLDINNINLEIQFLADINAEWKKWLTSKVDEGAIIQEKSGAIMSALRKSLNGMAVMDKPYSRYLQKNELDKYSTTLAADIKMLKAYKFMEKNMPNMYEKLNKMFITTEYTPAKEENFLVPGSMSPVWKSDLTKAEALVNALKPEDMYYVPKLEELSKLLPSTLMLGTKYENEQRDLIAKLKGKPAPEHVNPQIGALTNIDESKLNFEMGKKYLEIRDKIKILFEQRIKFLNTPKKPFVPVDPLEEKLKELLNEINAYIKVVNGQKDKSAYIEQNFSALANYNRTYTNIHKNSTEVVNALQTLEDLISGISEVDKEVVRKEQEIMDFYQKFKQEYESKNEYTLMAMLSNNWAADDGTTLTELEDNFRDMFNLYDSVQYSIYGFQTTKNTDNIYRVSYEITITGKVYEMDITRVEKSSVSEEVIFENGKLKINRTLSGRFWYRE